MCSRSVPPAAIFMLRVEMDRKTAGLCQKLGPEVQASGRKDEETHGRNVAEQTVRFMMVIFNTGTEESAIASDDFGGPAGEASSTALSTSDAARGGSRGRVRIAQAWGSNDSWGN